MKILVVGATGKTGELAWRKAVAEDLCVMSWFSDFRGSGGIDWSAVLPADA